MRQMIVPVLQLNTEDTYTLVSCAIQLRTMRCYAYVATQGTGQKRADFVLAPKTAEL